jgi:hypothetical protein
MSQALWDQKSYKNPGQVWNHAEGAKLFEETWPRLTRETVKKGWFWNEDTVEGAESESDSIQECDPDFIERVDEEELTSDWSQSEPSSTGAWEGRFSRAATARERANQMVIDPVLEIKCSLHDQPTVHPSWSEREWRMAKERTESEKKKAREEARDEIQREKDAEIRLEKEFLFQPSHTRKAGQVERVLDRDDFLFPRSEYGPFHRS